MKIALSKMFLKKYWSKNAKKSTRYNDRFFKKKLTPEQYAVMRQKETEPPFSGAYLYCDDSGYYRCAACGQILFDSMDKFASGCGWPSFRKARPNAILIRKDFSHFMIRDEVVCSRCFSHLGHLFNDGLLETAVRYCINSVALKFTKK